MFPSDADLIMSSFLRYCDERCSFGVRDLRSDQGAFSSVYYICDLASSISSSNPSIPVTTPLLIAQRYSKPSHFNIYINRTQSNTSQPTILELAVPEGRQNCYLAIICFLLSCQLLSDSNRGKGSDENDRERKRVPLLSTPLKELFVEVLGDI